MVSVGSRWVLKTGVAVGFAGAIIGGAVLLWPAWADPNRIVSCGKYPDMPVICCAAIAGETERVRRLIERGADINAVSLHGMTALRYAVKNGRYETARLLLQSGADPNDPFSKTSRSLLMQALISMHFGNPESRGFFLELLEIGADPMDRDMNTMVWAAEHVYVEELETMLTAMRDRDPARFTSERPVHLLLERLDRHGHQPHESVIEMLRRLTPND